MNYVLTHLPTKPGVENGFVSGRTVVSANFVEALCQYANDDRVIVYMPDGSYQPYTRELRNYQYPHRIELLNREELVELAKASTTETVILTLVTSLKPGQHLRAICGASSWPVLGLTHDISAQEVYHELLLTLLGKPQKFDAFVCTSDAALKAISSLQKIAEKTVGFQTNIEKPIIPLGISPELSSSPKSTIPDKKRKVITFLYLGRLSYTMKADLAPLISSISQSSLDKNKFKVILAGSVISPDEETVKRYSHYIREEKLDSIITIEENITDARRMELLSEADVLFSPVDSFQETFGLVLLEAMAMGLPIIASDWSGYKELIEEGKNGFLIPTIMSKKAIEGVSLSTTLADRWSWYGEMSQCVIVDYDSLIEKMRYFLEAPSIIDTMGQEGRKKVESKFQWPIVIQAYQKECRRLCELSSFSAPIAQLIPYSYDLDKVFSHYPTSTINGDTIIRAKASGKKNIVPLKCLPPFFNSNELEIAFESISGGLSIHKMPFSEYKAMRYASYFLKQNMAEIIESEKVI